MDSSLGSLAGSSSSPISPAEEYFQLFTNQYFRLYFGDTSVVDWFGKKIRGANRIHEFLKYEVWCQYDHKNLSEPIECEPFETMPSHFATRYALKKKQKQRLERNHMNLLGLGSLKTYAESDMDSDNDGAVPEGFKTPERTVPALDPGTLTPPPSSLKKTKDSTPTISTTPTNDSDSDLEEERKEKLPMKRGHKRPFHYLKHFPRKVRKLNNKTITKTWHESDEDFVSLDSSSEEEIETESPSEPEEYGPLKYLWVSGSLETKETACINTSSSSFVGCERQVRISLSYRQHLKNKSIQFALVLYENLDDKGQVMSNNPFLKAQTRKLLFLLNQGEDKAAAGEESKKDEGQGDEEEEDALSSSSTIVNVSDRSSDTASLTSIEGDADSLNAINPVTDSLAWMNPFSSTTTASGSRSAQYSNLMVHSNPLAGSIFFSTRSPTPPINVASASSSSTASAASPASPTSSTNLEPPSSLFDQDLERTPTKSTGLPTTPKRKSKNSKNVPVAVLKRLQEKPFSMKPPPKMSAARCLRL